MGNNSSHAVANILNGVDTTLKQNGQSTVTTTCQVKAGNITGSNWNNCNVDFENYCDASSAIAIGSIAEAAADAWDTLSDKMKASFLPGKNTNSSKQDIKNYIESEISQTCQADSSVTNEIAVGNITVDGCTNTNFKFINAGSAQANCALNSVVNNVAKTYAEASNESEGSDIPNLPNLCSLIGLQCTELANTVIYGCISSVVCCCIFLILIVLVFFIRK